MNELRIYLDKTNELGNYIIEYTNKDGEFISLKFENALKVTEYFNNLNSPQSE